MTDGQELRVRDFMIEKPATLRPDMNVIDAGQLLLSKEISGAPVLDDHGNLIGMLTERDLLKRVVEARYHNQLGAHVHECMTPDVKTVDIDESLMDVAARFAETKYHRYPVMEQNRLVGMIRRQDVLKAVLEIGAL